MYRLENYTPEGCTEGHMAAISDIDGSYIGNEEFAEKLKSMGIAAQARPGRKVASIGFSETDQKWFGWSHRAIFGFSVGSKVSRGDCAYVPTDWDDLIDDAIRFWSEEWHEEVIGVQVKDDDGLDCVRVEWRYSNEVPNEKLRGSLGGANMYPPEKWGRGEWEAGSLDDAKQMASDFAEGVS